MEEVKCSERDCHLPPLFSCLYHHCALCGVHLPAHLCSLPDSTHCVQTHLSALDCDTPLELVLQKVHLRHYYAAMKQQGLNIKWMLCAGLEHLTTLAKKLLMSETEKFILWDELQYLKLMTGRRFIGNDPITRMLNEIESESVAAVNGHFSTLPFVERETEEDKMTLMLGEDYQVMMLARSNV